MRTYETSCPPQDTKFAMAGTGHPVSRRCDKCGNKTNSHAGSSYVRFGLWYCPACTAARKVAKSQGVPA